MTEQGAELVSRYDRVRRAQKHGEAVRDDLHKDPDEREKDRDVNLPFPEWLLNFDAEQNAKALYPNVSRLILERGYLKPSERIYDCCRSS